MRTTRRKPTYNEYLDVCRRKNSARLVLYLLQRISYQPMAFSRLAAKYQVERGASSRSKHEVNVAG